MLEEINKRSRENNNFLGEREEVGKGQEKKKIS